MSEHAYDAPDNRLANAHGVAWTVRSKSDPGEVYTVACWSVDQDQIWTCTCPGFYYHKDKKIRTVGDPPICRHIDEVGNAHFAAHLAGLDNLTPRAVGKGSGEWP